MACVFALQATPLCSLDAFGLFLVLEDGVNAHNTREGSNDGCVVLICVQFSRLKLDMAGVAHTFLRRTKCSMMCVFTHTVTQEDDTKYLFSFLSLFILVWLQVHAKLASINYKS